MTIDRELIAPVPGTLLLPDGRAASSILGKPIELTEEGLAELTRKYTTIQGTFSLFYELATAGNLPSRVLRLTSSRSFMDQALSQLQQNAHFSNMWTELLHGSNTAYYSFHHVLPWVSIFADYFTSVPIPENLEALRAARDSLGPLTDIVANHREFYDGVLHGVRIPKITGETSFSGVDIYGLEFTLFADDRPVEPRLISSDSSTVQVVDHVYYNGLPADRSRYLTLMVGEGSRLALRIKNTSQDRLYAVVPTINGIPFRVKSLQLWYGGFEKGVLPVTGIAPDVTYLKPGQEHDYNGFFCNSIKIARGPDPMSHYNCIDDFGTSEELFALSFMFSQIFRRNMTEKDIALLEKLDNPEIAQKVMYESRLHAVRQFLKFLDQATETDIYVARPVPADSKASSELDNPYLGSIGIAVVEVSPPPVEARHEISYGGHYNQSKGGEAAMGVGGLAEIAGRRARAADKVDFWDSMRHDAMIHKFAGYVPVNLMSLRK